jgi:hypothetical protein
MHRAADSIATWFEMLIIISAPIVTATMGIHIAFNTFMSSFSQRFVEGYAIALSPELGESHIRSCLEASETPGSRILRQIPPVIVLGEDAQ